jgi:hypothetical protein
MRRSTRRTKRGGAALLDSGSVEAYWEKLEKHEKNMVDSKNKPRIGIEAIVEIYAFPSGTDQPFSEKLYDIFIEKYKVDLSQEIDQQGIQAIIASSKFTRIAIAQPRLFSIRGFIAYAKTKIKTKIKANANNDENSERNSKRPRKEVPETGSMIEAGAIITDDKGRVLGETKTFYRNPEPGQMIRVMRRDVSVVTLVPGMKIDNPGGETFTIAPKL